MKASVYTKYGSPEVLQIKEVAKPTPKDNEILIKVRATTVTSGDARARSLNVPAGLKLLTRLVFGFTKPKKTVLGSDFAGDIEAAGKNVTEFKTGDQVFGTTEMKLGAHAEYICLPEDAAVTTKPANMSYEEAASVPFGANAALLFLRAKGEIQSGQKILIYGASGSVGTAAVQLAKHDGADVTGVCSTKNIEMVKALGADKVIDYTQEDFTQNGETYDIIMDTVGKIAFSQCKPSLTEKGIFLLVTGGLPEMGQMLWSSMFGSKKVKGGPVFGRKENIIFLKELIEAEKFKAVIDRCYPLEQIAEAHKLVDTGHKKGNVVINVA